MANQDFPLIFERSKENRISYSLPELDVPVVDLEASIGNAYVRKKAPDLPEVSELELMRHYTGLSNRNFGIDSGFYPLGSCTMKYNPKINEDVARLDGFSHIHPYQDTDTVQGALEMMYDLQSSLSEITGMAHVSLKSAAGAHGEWKAIMMIRDFHVAIGELKCDNVIIHELVNIYIKVVYYDTM